MGKTVASIPNTVITIPSVRPHKMFLFALLILDPWSSDQPACQTLSGTSVIGIRYDNVAFIGADSKGVWEARGRSRSEYSCKIHVLNNSIIFAESGIVATPRFDVKNLAQRALSLSGGFDDFIMNFAITASEAVRKELTFTEREMGKEALLREYANKSVFEVLFVGLQADKIKMQRQVYFFVVSRDTMQIVIEGKVAPQDRPAGYVIPIGGTDKLRDSVTVSNFLDHGPIYTVNALIGIDAFLSPETISQPIDIIMFTRHGPMWLQKKGECD